MIGDLTRLSGGASRVTYRFTADGTPRIAQLAAAGMGDMATEAAVLRVVKQHGAQVADVIAFDDDAGDPMVVLEHVEGETIARKILRDDEYAEARPRLARQCGAALAVVHATPIDELPALPDVDAVARLRESLDAVGEPHPAFELAFRWLDDHPAPSRPATLVHGDFRLGNLIVGPGGLCCIVDWEGVHLGNPVEDLGWVCTKAWRFGAPEPVAGVGRREDLIGAYEAAGGGAVSLDELRWWEVLGSLKWGIICMTQANRHFAGTTRSHELAAIGRRAAENEYDLFQLLEGNW